MDISSDSKLKSLSVKQAKAADKDPGDSVNDLLNWNNLTYVMPTTNSTTDNRNRKAFNADNYNAELNLMDSPHNVIIRLQTGQEYVDFKKSHLYLRMGIVTEYSKVVAHTVTATEDIKLTSSYDFGVMGSVANIIDEVLVTTRTGTVLSRLQNFAQWRAITHRLQKTPEWFSTVGAGMGYLQPNGTIESNLTAEPAERFTTLGESITIPKGSGSEASRKSGGSKTQEQGFCIPLCELSPVFNSPMLCPQTLASGLEIQIRTRSQTGTSEVGPTGILGRRQTPELSHATTATDTDFGKSLDFEITKLYVKDVHVVLDCHSLSPAPAKVLRDTSARNGLEYVYDQVHSHVGQASSNNNSIISDGQNYDISFQINKAVSRAMSGFCAILPDVSGTTYTRTKLAEKNVMMPDPLLGIGTTTYFDNVQWRLGHFYYPHQIVQASRNSRRILDENLYAFDSKETADTTGPQILAGTFRAYGAGKKTVGSQANKTTYGPFSLSAVTFERSNLLHYSGSPLNNSRTLSFSGSFSTKAVQTGAEANVTEKYKVYQFLHYLSVCKAFLNNHVVTI